MGLAKLEEDQVKDAFGAVFVFENVGAVAKDFALFWANSFDSGWGAIGPENEAEDEEWSDKLLTKQLNFLGRMDIEF